MTVVPDLPDLCWPIDEACCADWGSYDMEVQDRAVALATQTLRALTAYQVGGCPITVRPCKRACAEAASTWYWSGSTFYPMVVNGVWVNSCGCLTECGCTALEELLLPAPVRAVEAVKEDGAVLDPSAYRLDAPNRLVRLDGVGWPTCQEMDKADTEVGTLSVTYLNSHPVDGLGAYAAGVLACEYAKACTTGKCRLPSGVTDITRAGVTMTITTGMFPGGVTGIKEVDTFLMRYNPNALRMPPRVWSPDLRSTRTSI